MLGGAISVNPTMPECNGDRLLRRPGYPTMRAGGHNEVDVTRSNHRRRLAKFVVRKECNGSCKRSDELNVRFTKGIRWHIQQQRWAVVGHLGESPDDWSVAYDEVLTVWRIQDHPPQSWKHSDLEVPRLEVDDRAKVILSDTKSTV